MASESFNPPVSDETLLGELSSDDEQLIIAEEGGSQRNKRKSRKDLFGDLFGESSSDEEEESNGQRDEGREEGEVERGEEGEREKKKRRISKTDQKKQKDLQWIDSAIANGRRNFAERDPGSASVRSVSETSSFLETANSGDGPNSLSDHSQVVALVPSSFEPTEPPATEPVPLVLGYVLFISF